MKQNRLSHLLALCLVLCLLVGALPASALTLGKLSQIGAPVTQMSEAQAKSTTKLAPPKTMKLKVGEVKRVKLGLKYKIAPDAISVVLDRNDRVLLVTDGPDLFALALDTGEANMYVQSGIKVAQTKFVISEMPYTGIFLEGDLLRAHQYESGNLNRFVIPATAISQVKWSSDKPGVVKVGAGGSITCKKPGNAILTCKTKKGKLVGSVLCIVS